MAITVRNDKTLKTINELEKKLNIKTKTGVLDHVVARHLDLVSSLKSAKTKINTLENELYEIKKVIRDNSQAVKSFAQMCDKINSKN